jgi:hypothetical protein
MSSFFEDLEAQLHAAARAQIAVNHANHKATRSWTRSTIRGIPILLAVSTSIAIAVLALVLIGHKQPNLPSNQPGGTPPAASGPPAFLHLTRTQDKEIVYLFKAEGTADRRDQTCSRLPPGLGDPGRTPSLNQGSPSGATLATLGVLRRAAEPSDRLPPRIIGAPPNQRVYPNGTIPPVTGVYVRYIRKARHRFGANYYLVPAENVNLNPPLPERCYREQEAALRQEFPRIPSKLRAGTLALEPRYLAYQRQTTVPYPGVCVLALNGTGNGDGDCGAGGSLTQIENGQAVGGGAPTGAEVYYGLAPDGVRSITFYFHSKYVHHPVTALVISNVFIVRNYRGRLGAIAKEIWRASTGRIIKVIHRS